MCIAATYLLVGIQTTKFVVLHASSVNNNNNDDDRHWGASFLWAKCAIRMSDGLQLPSLVRFEYRILKSATASLSEYQADLMLLTSQIVLIVHLTSYVLIKHLDSTVNTAPA